MQTEELISVREYLSTDYSPDCDYVDGVVEEGMLEAAELRTERPAMAVPLEALFE